MTGPLQRSAIGVSTTEVYESEEISTIEETHEELERVGRILASDDPDPLFTTSTMEVPRFHPNGSVTTVNETIGTFPFEFDGENIRASETLELTYSTDLYRTTLQHWATDVPFADRWRSLQDERFPYAGSLSTVSTSFLMACDDAPL